MDARLAAEARLLRELVKLAGRRPQEFRLRQDAGQIQVFGREAVASYPRQAWTSALMRDLHRGYFDTRVPFAAAACGLR